MPSELPIVRPGSMAGPGASPPPVFERIGIVGLGLIGGSIALAARRLWPRSLVIGVDRNEVLEKAMVRHAMDVAADDLGLLSEAQVVILAAPVAQNIAVLGELPGYLPAETVVTDVGSTKREIAEAARRLPPRLAFVGGHPLAGAARGGIDHASPDLFLGRPWIFTPVAGEGDPAVGRLSAFAEALGARPYLMSAAEHDHLVASLSHLPQLAASALMSVIGPAAGEAGLALAGRGLVDTTRLASSPAGVWADICGSNRDEIDAALGRLIARLQELRAGLDEPAAIARVFDEAARWRETLARRARVGDREPTRAGESDDAAG